MSSLFCSISDYEHIAVFLIIALLFYIGCRKRSEVFNTDGFVLDKDFSNALKSIACILILQGHFEQMHFINHDDLPHSIGYYVWCIAPNVALVWFMFISGYGLSLKNIKTDFLKVGINRCLKVFLPMSIVFLISLILYYFLPLKFTIEESTALAIPSELPDLHNISFGNIMFILAGSIRWYWYVWCILMFYIIFYFSIFLSRKTAINQTWILFVLLVVYYIVVFNVLGASLAHYYRLTWAFLFGHLFAKWSDLSMVEKWVIVPVSLVSFIFESKFMILSFVVSIVLLLLCSIINRCYVYKNTIILYLGFVSYFFYLIHRRIAWVIECYLNLNDMLVWILITLVCTIPIYLLYKKYVSSKL